MKIEGSWDTQIFHQKLLKPPAPPHDQLFFLLRNFFNYLTRKMFIPHTLRAFFHLLIIFKQISEVFLSCCAKLRTLSEKFGCSFNVDGGINLPRSKNHSFVRETYLRMFRGNFLQAKIMKEIFLAECEEWE